MLDFTPESFNLGDCFDNIGAYLPPAVLFFVYAQYFSA